MNYFFTAYSRKLASSIRHALIFLKVLTPVISLAFFKMWDLTSHPGTICLSAEFPPCKPRFDNGVPPMTIPQFKEWASQTGVETLQVADLTLWKSRKAPWHHEFIVVTLEPHQNFKPKALPTTESPLYPFDLEKNIKRGLRFRIDRGRQEKQSRLPPLGSSGSHPDAADLVELINLEIKLDGIDPCFTYLSPEPLRAAGDAFFSFFAPRVNDVMYCVDRTLDGHGAKYKLYNNNCWTFAFSIFNLMTNLFAGGKRLSISAHKNFSQTRFFRKLSRYRTPTTRKPNLKPSAALDWIQEFNSIS